MSRTKIVCGCILLSAFCFLLSEEIYRSVVDSRLITMELASQLVGGDNEPINVSNSCCYIDSQCEANEEPCSGMSLSHCDGEPSWTAHNENNFAQCQVSGSSPNRTCTEEGQNWTHYCGLSYECEKSLLTGRCTNGGDPVFKYVPAFCSDSPLCPVP
jgi:hypothetical protein